jgi:hypothetical protein
VKRAYRLLLVLLLLGAQGAPAPRAAIAAEGAFAPRSYPLPIGIDVGKPPPCPTCKAIQPSPETIMRSSLFLTFMERDVHEPFLEFAARPLDDRERLFVATVRAIHDKDLKTFAAVWGSTRPKPDSDSDFKLTSVAGIAVGDPRGSFEMYRRFGVFSALENVRVESEILEGSALIFVYSAQASGPFGTVRSKLLLEVNANAAGRLKITDGSDLDQRDAIGTLISRIMERTSAAPTTYKPVGNLHTAYRYAIPLEGEHDAGTHPVYLQFAGTPLDYTVADGPPPSHNPVLEAMRRDYLALERKDFAAFTAGCTSGTRQGIASFGRWSDHFDQPHGSATAREYYRVWAGGQNQVQPRVLQPQNTHYRFMINADPVYLLFYSVAGHDSGRMTYEYVYKDASGNYLLANGYSAEDLDAFLQATNLFDQRILN